MADSTKTPLKNLIALGKIDNAIARILAEKKQLGDKLAKKNTELKQAQNSLVGKERAYKERKLRFDREEQSIREEREKLVARRKALASLNNYKVQQAAEKEIEHANRQLATREETLLTSLEELDSSQSESSEIEKIAAQCTADKQELETEIRAVYPELEAREKELKSQRDEVIARILPAYLHNYERISGQYFSDPIVPVNVDLKSCTGCHMQIRPQVFVELHKGEKIVNCAGCGRILYLEETDSPKESE